jgi:hypothetical protein
MRTAARTIALVCLVALGAVACSSDDPAAPAAGGTVDAEAILQQASDDLAERSVEATFELRGEGGGERFEMTGDLQIDPAREQAHASMTFAGMPGVRGETSMEFVLDGTDVYVRGAMFPDAGWIKIDADHAGMHGSFGGSGQMDPTAFLEFLRGAKGVEIVGTEEVRGHETTHFSGVIDPAQLIEAAPSGEKRDAAADAIAGLEGRLGDVEMTFDAWVDDAGVPWRFSIAFAPERLDADMEMTFDVLELGGDVRIEVPSGKDVTDLGSVQLPTAA